MIAELDGETRAVLRHRRGVMWCPFCDRSRQEEGLGDFCEGCHAKFTEDAAETVIAAPEEAPRRRGAATTSTPAEPAEEAEEPA